MSRALGCSWSLVVLLAAAGCGDDGGATASRVRLHPVPGCESIDPAPCDVLDTACQTRLLELAACMRGSAAGALPPVSRMTEAQFTQYLMAELAAEQPAPNLDHYERGLAMLGLVAPGAFTPSSMAAAQAARVAGYYRHDVDDIVLIDRGEPADDIQVNGVMLHELVHALQDRDQDLSAWFDQQGDSYDAALAARSVVEGEARFHQERYGVSLLGLDPAAADLSMHFDRTVALADAWIRAQPSPYLASFSAFPYEFGGRRVNARFAARGSAIVPELFASPFADTRSLLDPHDDVARPAGPSLLAPAPPADWTLTQETTLGAWLTYVFLAMGGVTNPQLQALSWRSDRLWVYGGTTDRSATTAVWRIAFADAAVATTVAQGLMLRFRFVVQQSGSELTVVATNAALAIDWATAAAPATAAAAAPARSDGRMWWPRGNRPMLP